MIVAQAVARGNNNVFAEAVARENKHVFMYLVNIVIFELFGKPQTQSVAKLQS